MPRLGPFRLTSPTSSPRRLTITSRHCDFKLHSTPQPSNHASFYDPPHGVPEVPGSLPQEQRARLAETPPGSRWCQAVGQGPARQVHALSILRLPHRDHRRNSIHDGPHGARKEDVVWRRDRREGVKRIPTATKAAED